MKWWNVGCIVAALAGALVAGCSDGHGPVNGSGSPEAYETIDAPLYVYEILADRMAVDSTAIDILDMLAEPRVEQLLMNHVPEELVHVQAKREAAAAFGIDSVQLASDSGAVMLAVSAMVQNRASKEETQNFIRNLGEDLKGDGVWNDPNWKIRIADWVVGLRMRGRSRT